MQVPVQVTFRHMPKSDQVEAECWKEAAKLDRYFDRIMGCRIVIDEPHRHHAIGNLFQVRIDVTVPGGELVITREPPQHHESEDFHVALREAFDSMRRRLEDHVRTRRGDIKVHKSTPTGRVARLFADEGYGFIEDTGGREIYFHRNSVLGAAYHDLKVGDEVSFTEEAGEKGAQASTVHLLKHARRRREAKLGESPASRPGGRRRSK